MILNDNDIYKRIKYSDSPKKTMKELASLNRCSVECIEQIYHEQTALNRAQKIEEDRKRRIANMGRGKYSDEFKQQILDCIKEGLNEKQTRVRLGQEDANSGFTQLFYKLKQTVPVNIPILSAKNTGAGSKVTEDVGIKHEGFTKKLPSIKPDTTQTSSVTKKVDSRDYKMTSIVEKALETSGVAVKEPPKSVSKVEKVESKSIEATSKIVILEEESKEVKVENDKPKKEEKVIEDKPKGDEEIIKDMPKKDNKVTEESKKKSSDSLKDSKKTMYMHFDTSNLKELLSVLKAKKSSLKSIINTKEMELQLLKETLNSYRAIIDDIEDVIEESEELND